MDALLSNVAPLAVLSYLEFSDLCSLRVSSSRCRDATELHARQILSGNDLVWALTLSSPRSMLARLYVLTRPRILLMGGNVDSRKVSRFDAASSKFTTLCTFSLKRVEAFACVWHQGRCCAISGCFDPTLGSVESFNPVLNVWTEAPRLPRRIDSLAAASDGRSLYVVGGHDHGNRRRSEAIFVLNDGRWDEVAVQLSCGRSNHAAAFHKGCLWVAGGVLGPRLASPASSSNSSSSSSSSSIGPVATATCEIVDFRTGTVTFAPPMLKERYQLKMLTIRGRLYAVAGDMAGAESAVNTVEMFDDTQWRVVTTFPTFRTRCAVAALGGVLYVFGGADERGRAVMDWDAYDVDSDRWLSMNDAAEAAEGVGSPTRRRALPTRPSSLTAAGGSPQRSGLIGAVAVTIGST